VGGEARLREALLQARTPRRKAKSLCIMEQRLLAKYIIGGGGANVMGFLNP
jgi:hypothetical protein